MALESAQYIDSLVDTNPTGLDQARTSDDHLRLIKASLKRTFPNVTGEVAPTHTELNYVDGVTSSIQAQFDTLDSGKLSVSATAVYAQSAGAASSAVFATSASRAGGANSAIFANSSNYALSAAYAASAANATNAVNATNATNATNAASAIYAYSARAAGSAVFATSATRATSALYATNYDNAVSAGQLPSATTAAIGAAELATTAEAVTGTEVSRILTSAAFAGNKSLGASGYYTFPGGFTIQWGTSTFGTATVTMTDVAVTFPVAFTTVYQVVGGPGGSDATASGYKAFVGIDTTSLATTGFQARYDKDQTDGTFILSWIAVGVI